MLEFLGFIALIAIIFGISFGAALEGFIKFILIGACLILALCIIMKLLESKKGAIFVLVASIIAVIVGADMAFNDSSYNSMMQSCFTIKDASIYAHCALGAMDDRNEKNNCGWGYIIVGSGLVLWSLTAYGGLTENEKPKKKH